MFVNLNRDKTNLDHGVCLRRSISIPGNERPNPMKEEIKLQVEELEERIAPSNPPGQLGYEGQPGNQGNGLGGYEGQPGNQGGN